MVDRRNASRVMHWRVKVSEACDPIKLFADLELDGGCSHIRTVRTR